MNAEAWKEASRYADALAGEGGLEHAAELASVEISELVYVAEQRALRALLVQTGRLGEVDVRNLSAVALSPQERRWLRLATVVALDGLFIGWLAHKLATTKEEA